MSNTHRRVLVVGATGRLGVAVASALAKRGDEVVLTARDGVKLEHLAALIQDLHPKRHRPQTIGQNLLEEEAPEHVARAATDGGGRVTDLVLACGPFPRTPVETLARQDLDLTLRVHAVAPLLLVNALAGEISRHDGAVVALTDSGVARPYPNHVAYLTAKGALESGLRALAVEHGPKLRINCLSLGIVADPEADADPLRTHRLATRSTLGRFGTAEEVVHGVMALLGATWATGEIWGLGT